MDVSESLKKKITNLFLVLGNIKFMLLLLIFSLYWIMFWQEFIVLPYYIVDFIDPHAPYELIQSWSAAGAIILLQIPVNYMTKHVPTRKALLIGFAISSLCWLIVGLYPSIPTIVAGIIAFALGEITQAPRYYEYVSEIAPPGQQGLFQGYSFLPIAIALFVGDPFGGWMYENLKHGPNPEMIFFALFGVGILATLLMFIYNFFVGRHEAAASRV
jgi:MFS family permease